MEKSYMKFAEALIDIIKQNPLIELIDIDYEKDKPFLYMTLLNPIENEFASFNISQWEESMKAIPLISFSFTNYSKGNVKSVYNCGSQQQKQVLLSTYKKLVEKIYGRYLLDKILESGKDAIHKSDKINLQLNDLTKNLSNFKQPEYLAKLIDVVIFDDDIRKELCKEISLFEIDDNLDPIEFISTIIEIMMNINIKFVPYTQNVYNYVGEYISILFNKSMLLKNVMNNFKNQQSANYNCGCNEKLCPEMNKYQSTTDIKYVERQGYKPVHILKHLKHIILKLISVYILLNKEQVLKNKKTELYDYITETSRDNIDVIELMHTLDIDGNVKLSELAHKLYNNKEKVLELGDKYKPIILDSIINYIKSSKFLNDSIKDMIINIIREQFNNLEVNDLKSQIDAFQLKSEQVTNFINLVEKYLNIPIKKNISKIIKH